MELLSESSTGGRALYPRHISSEKQLVRGNGVNTTALCLSPDFPDIDTYFAGLQLYGTVIWAGGAILVISTLVFFCVTLQAVSKNRPKLISFSAFVLAVYPVVSIMSFTTLVVPRARLLAEAISQEVVMIAMYQLYLFFIGECGGPDQLIRRAEGARLETRVPPCCCWPCCILPRPTLQTKRLLFVRMLVLQMSIIQGAVYIVLLTLWAENPLLYLNNYLYFQPVVIASILTGIWGMSMAVRASAAAGGSPWAKFLSLQFVLLIVKAQGGLFTALPKLFTLPCHPPLTPVVYAHLIHHGLTLVQMLLLSIWVWRIYSTTPIKSSDNKIQQVKVVAVLDDSMPASPDRKSLKDGIGLENAIFTIENKKR